MRKKLRILILLLMVSTVLLAQKPTRSGGKKNPSLTKQFNTSAKVKRSSQNRMTNYRQQFNNSSGLPRIHPRNIANRGSTGRIASLNRNERLALARLKMNPARNVRSIGQNADPRWRNWRKMHYKDQKNGTAIHFNRRLRRNGKYQYGFLLIPTLPMD